MNKMQHISRYFFLPCLLAAVLAGAASSCGEHKNGPEPPADKASRTVLVYMAANNNLSRYSHYDLAEMQKGANEGAIGNGGRLIVYHDEGNPTLIEIKAGQTDTLKQYSASGAYAVESSRMSEVIADAKRFAPAEDYGLVLWSHGTGWIQNGMELSRSMLAPDPGEEPVRPYSFGADRGRTMNVSTLASVLEGEGFSWLYFDCCFMASAEVAYELRHAVPLIVGSQIELPANGMPYDRNLPHFFAKGKADLTTAARTTYDYYTGMQGAYCAMSIIDTRAMDRLASATAAIYGNASIGYPEGYTVQDLYPTSPGLHFDFRDYVAALCMGADGSTEQWAGASSQLAAFDSALASAVVFEEAIPYVPFGHTLLPLEKHCGLGTFIIKDESSVSDINHYDSLEWYDDVASKLRQ